MNNSENLKTACDTFGRLSFLMETYVKLHQTGDHKPIAQGCLDACVVESEILFCQLTDISKTSKNE